MTDINKLLNKKGWTGRELGILEVSNMAIMFKEALAGEEPKGIVSQQQLQKMINTIKDREQGLVYNGYISIHEWLSLKYNIAQTQFQQAQLQYRTIERYVSQAILSEDVYQYVEQLPAIMTQKQLDELRAERLEAYFKAKDDGTELESNIFNLVTRAIAYYLRKLEEEPSKANPLKAIRKKYIAEPVKSKYILSRYNEVAGNGYYTLEDGSGKRSDKMPLEEWQEAVNDIYLDIENSTEYTADEKLLILDEIRNARIICRAKAIFNGATEEEADAIQEAIEQEHGYNKKCLWHFYEEPPEDLTKWDIIEQELLLELYPADMDGSGDAYSENNFTASMEDFVAEFKELVDAMLSDMDKKYFSKDEVKAAKLPVSEWESTTISWRRLYELDFYGEKAIAESDAQTFDGNRRALFNGIAILRASDIIGESRLIDERGYYAEPKIETALASHSLQAFFTESDEYTANTELIAGARKALLDSLYFLKGYNLAVDMTADYYDIPDISVFKADLSVIEDQIDEINGLVPILYRQIKDTDYQDKELQARKLEVLQDFFGEIDYQSLEIPEENVQQAKDLIPQFKAYSGHLADCFYNLLCIRPEEEEEGGY